MVQPAILSRPALPANRLAHRVDQCSVRGGTGTLRHDLAGLTGEIAGKIAVGWEPGRPRSSASRSSPPRLGRTSSPRRGSRVGSCLVRSGP